MRIQPWDAQTLHMHTHVHSKHMHLTIILRSNIMVQNRIKSQFFDNYCTKTCECKLVMSLAKCTSLKTKSSIYDFSIVVTNVNMNEWFC